MKLLVKIGGSASIDLETVSADLGLVDDASLVIVHGANALRDSLATRLGVEKQVVTSVSGYDSVFSDDEAIDLLLMAYAGLRNKRLVEALQRHGVNAVGLTGLDGALIRGRRNRGIRVREGEKTLIKRDLSGKPVVVNRKLLGLLLDNGFAPVLTVPIVDEQGVAVNSENDDIVALLDVTLKPDVVIQLIEAPGYLEDPRDMASLVPRMTWAELAELEAEATGRMKRKMLALKRLGARQGARVMLADGRSKHPVRDALAGRGTLIA